MPQEEPREEEPALDPSEPKDGESTEDFEKRQEDLARSLSTNSSEMRSAISTLDESLSDSSFKETTTLDNRVDEEQGRESLNEIILNIPAIPSSSAESSPPDHVSRERINAMSGELTSLSNNRTQNQGTPTEKEKANVTKTCIYLGAVFGFSFGAISIGLGIWSIINTYRPPLAEINDEENPKSNIKKIVSAWQKLPEKDFWKHYASVIDNLNFLTINDHVFYLQLTMEASPVSMMIWDSEKDRIAIVDEIVSYYNNPEIYISDIYKKISEINYQENQLPRAEASSLLILSLAEILRLKLPIKRKAKNAALLASPNLGIDDGTKEDIANALNIVGTLSWAIPEAGPFVGAGIQVIDWIFGLNSHAKQPFNYQPIFDAIAKLGAAIETFIKEQALYELIKRVSTYSTWLSNTITLVSELQSHKDPVGDTVAAIMQTDGLLHNLSEFTSPNQDKSLFDIIEGLIVDSDFSLKKNGDTIVGYQDANHWEMVKTKYSMLLTAISIYLNGFKLKIMLQRYVKNNTNIDNFDLKESVEFQKLYDAVNSNYEPRVSTDKKHEKTSIYFTMLARRKAAVTVEQDPNFIIIDANGNNVNNLIFDNTNFPHNYWDDGNKANRPNPFYGLYLNNMDIKHDYRCCFYECRDAQKYQPNSFTENTSGIQEPTRASYSSSPAGRGGLFNLYYYDATVPVSYIRDACSKLDPETCKRTWALLPDICYDSLDSERIGYEAFNSEILNKKRREYFWEKFNTSINNELNPSKVQEILEKWNDCVETLSTSYAPNDPKMTIKVTNFQSKTLEEDDVWSQPNVYVRYGISYFRKNAQNSNKSWTEWVPTNGKSHPTLEGALIECPKEIDIIHLFRQFYASTDGPPSQKDGSKTFIQLIYNFNTTDQLFPSTYTDNKAASKKLLNTINSESLASGNEHKDLFQVKSILYSGSQWSPAIFGSPNNRKNPGTETHQLQLEALPGDDQRNSFTQSNSTL